MAIRVLFPSSSSSSFSTAHATPTPRTRARARWTSRQRLLCCFSSSTSSSDEVSSSMTVSITGATRFVGRRLVHKLLSEDHKVCVLTRSTSKNKAASLPCFAVSGRPSRSKRKSERCIKGSTGVVNLAGMPISTRWSPQIKKEIMQSRINVTSKFPQLEHEASSNANGNGPSVFVSATAVGYYGVSRMGGRARQAKQEHVRLVLLRSESSSARTAVPGQDDPLFMMFAGGPLGTGTQWFSWIHLDDLVDLIYESLRTRHTRRHQPHGAPTVRLSELCDRLGQVVDARPGCQCRRLAIKALLGEGATVVLDGQKVLPARPPSSASPTATLRPRCAQGHR
ncbi:hypothetical protein ZWY2020_011320 [Hordeum vulgare]|nr:hypothetical protein ZWY2020_011320 [Hordeum vulgare]